MKKLILLVLALLAPLICDAATGSAAVDTWYVRPASECSFNGDGLSYGCAASGGAAGAFKSFSGLIWTATVGIDDGDTLYVCGSFVSADHTDSNYELQVGASGSVGSKITINGDCSAQRTNPASWVDLVGTTHSGALLDGENLQALACLFTNSKTSLLLENIKATRCTSAATPTFNTAIKMFGAGAADIEAKFLDVDTTPGQCYEISGNTTTNPQTGVWLHHSIGSNCGSMGLIFNNSSANNLAEYNSISNTGLSAGAHGISGHPTRSTAASGWASAGGGVYTRTFATFHPLLMVKYTVQPYVWLTENTGTPTTPGTNEFGYSGTTIYVNLGGTDPSTQNMIWSADDNYGNIVRYNRVTGARAFGGAEGIGISPDDVTRSMSIIGNYINDTGGQGIKCNKCDSMVAESNIISNGVIEAGLGNSEGIITSGKNALILNNTVYNYSYGIDTDYSTTPHTATVQNNLLLSLRNCTVTGFTFGSGYSALNNAVYNSPAACNGWTQTNGVTADPKLTGGVSPTSPVGFTPNPGSSLIRAGICYYTTGCLPLDYLRHRVRVPPDIGAVQHP